VEAAIIESESGDFASLIEDEGEEGSGARVVSFVAFPRTPVSSEQHAKHRTDMRSTGTPQTSGNSLTCRPQLVPRHE
jgi:hypothetical protein